MRRESKLSVVQSSLLAFLVAAAILSLSGCQTSTTGSDPTRAPAGEAGQAGSGAAAEQPSAGAGMQVHIDPETGEFLDEPPPGAGLGGDVPTPPSDAVERPAPGGGVMIEIQPKPPATTD